MRESIRTISNKAFELLAGSSAVLLACVLAVILGPMLYKGSSAVVFDGTVEFRKMQLSKFGQGDSEEIEKEMQSAMESRNKVYAMLDDFKQGLDAESLIDEAKGIYRQFGKELKMSNVTGEAYSEARSMSRKIRKQLEAAFTSNDREEITVLLAGVNKQRDNEILKGTAAAEFFDLADRFATTVAKVDLSKREEYSEQVAEVEEIIRKLLGPAPGEPMPSLAQHQFGATRMDMAERDLHELFITQQWVQVAEGKSLEKREVPRKEYFAGTSLEPMFGYIENHLDEMLRPRKTFYWRYFFQDSTPGHYFGGVGPEIYGTILLTFVSMLFVIPFGIVSAAYLVECAGDNIVIRIIRMCINTLAGVPSIVFGLFGLAFFVLFFIPNVLGGEGKPCILAGSMTLAVLTLPVMIRASEEAIRAVPRTYKEASLALGSSAFRTFMTVTLPAALPGILTGVILSLSRVAGETAPIILTGAIALGPVPDSIFEPTRTLSYGSYDIAVGDRLSNLVPHNQYGMVVTLVGLVLIFNAIAIVLRMRIDKKLQGR